MAVVPRRLPPSPAERLNVAVNRMSPGSAAGSTRFAKPVPAVALPRARSVATALNDFAGFNVVGFGAVGDDTVDDTAAIQAAINAAAVDGGQVYFPSNVYRITTALALKPGVSLTGCGAAASVIHQTSTSKNGVTLTSPSEIAANLTIRDLGVKGPGSGTGVGIRIGTTTGTGATPCDYLVISDVTVSNFGSHGLWLSSLIVSRLQGVLSVGNDGHGFWLDGTNSWVTSTTVDSCYANACGMAGYKINKATYLALHGCATDSCGVGYDIYDLSASTLTSCGCEVATNRSSSYPGISYRIDGSTTFGTTALNLVGCYATEGAGDHYQWKGYSSGVMTGSRAFSSAGSPPDALNVGPNSAVLNLGPVFQSTMGTTISGQVLNALTATADGTPEGLSHGPSAPHLLPWSDSVQIINRGATSNVALVLKGVTGQGAAIFAIVTSTGANVLSVYANGAITFGPSETTSLAHPVGADFLSTNAPFKPGQMFASAASLPAASAFYGCVGTVVTGSGPVLVISDGAHWLSPVAGYWQPVSDSPPASAGPLTATVYGSIGALPAASGVYGGIAIVISSKGPVLVISDGAHWLTPSDTGGSGYWQPVA